jgi:hypothetical protein
MEFTLLFESELTTCKLLFVCKVFNVKHTKFLLENLTGKRPFGKPMHGWEDRKINISESGCLGVDWIQQVTFRFQ